jgi:hypothetical protein
MLAAGGNVLVENLPATWHGIPFLRNGFPRCVAVNSGASADRILVASHTNENDRHIRTFVWNSATDRLGEKPGN